MSAGEIQDWQRGDLRDIWRNDADGVRLLEVLPAADAEVPVIQWPDDAGLLAALRLFAVPEENDKDIFRFRDLVSQREDAQWLLDRHVAALRANMDTYTRALQFLGLPQTCGDFGRFFYVLVYAAMLPYSLDFLNSRRIPEDVIAATFADVSYKMGWQSRRYGQSGLWVPSWLTRHFRGMIFQLGRLQFERSQLNEYLVGSVQAAGFDYEAGSPVLALHIPDFMGPMTPQACDESFAWARDFFPAYFPDMPVEIAFCNSWLLDTQLPEHLPPFSNIVQFQQRFTIPVQGERDDSGVATFVWARETMPETMPEHPTSLERALIGFRQQGGHWGTGLGWMRLG